MAKLGDLLDTVVDHRGKTPKKLGVDFTETGVPVISAKLVSGGSVDFASARYVSEETWERWMPVRLKIGDVLLTSEAPLGRTAEIKSNAPVVLGQRLFALRGKQGVLDSRYLRYWLDSEVGQSELYGRATGTTVIGIKQSLLLGIEINVPNFDAQIAVSSVLGALDDKIAVNNQILFTSDALIRETYENLPTSTSVVLGDICKNARTAIGCGSINPGRRLVGLEHFDSRLMWLSRSTDSSSAGSAKNAFQKNDVLFGKLRPYFHKVCIAPSDGYCSTDILVLRANNPQHAGLLLAAASSDSVVGAAVQNSNGTRMPRAKWEDISNCAIPDPLNVLTKELNELVNLIIEKCSQVVQENQTLAHTRDELLPLLMSGKISVREAEEAVAEVGVEKREGEDNVQ